MFSRRVAQADRIGLIKVRRKCGIILTESENDN